MNHKLHHVGDIEIGETFCFRMPMLNAGIYYIGIADCGHFCNVIGRKRCCNCINTQYTCGTCFFRNLKK